MNPRFLADPRIRVPLFCFAALMAMLSLQRAAVLWGLADHFVGVARGELARAFLVGLRYDLTIALMLTAPLVAICAATSPRWLASGWWRTLVASAVAALLGATLFVLVVDYFFFAEFEERLNHKAFNYLEFGQTYALIWDEYPVVWALLAVTAVLVAAVWLLRKPVVQGRDYTCPLPRLVVWLAIAIPVMVIGIRGGVGQKGINTGAAYFTDSANLAQLTLNGVFTLREAAYSRLVRHRELGEHVPQIPDDAALAAAAEMIAQPADRFLNDPVNPLRRVTDTRRPRRDHNVVVVVLESLHWAYLGSMGAEEGLTPELDKLAAEGLLMDRCFAVGTRTTRGFAGIVGGFPDLPGRSVTTRIEAEGNFLTLGHVLQRRGYETLFIYGGDPLYDHRQAFLRSNGFERTVCRDQLESRTFRTHLGWCDEDLYAQAHREFLRLQERNPRKPFGAVLLTLSFHRPYDIPPGKIAPPDPGTPNAKEIDCVRYTDWAIGRFMEQARQSPYFDETIFVFVADHMGGFREYPIDATAFRVPFLIYAPKILAERRGERVSAVCSQTDVAPTIVSLLGGEYEHCFFGSSVLDRPADRGQAMMRRDNGTLMFVDADEKLVVLTPNGVARLYQYETPAALTPLDTTPAAAAARRDELVHRAATLLTAAQAVFERGAYSPHPVPDAKFASHPD